MSLHSFRLCKGSTQNRCYVKPAPLDGEELQGHRRKARPSHCRCVASAQHFLISAFTRKLHLERRREPQVHAGHLHGTLGGRKNLGRNVFDPLKGRRGQSDNSCSEVWVRCCMPLTPNARLRQRERQQAETGMRVQKTAKGGEGAGADRCGALTMSWYHTGCFTEVVSPNLCDVPKSRRYHKTVTDKETEA